MPDELSLLKEIGTDEDAPVELESRLRARVVERAESAAGRVAWRGGRRIWTARGRVRVGAALVAAATAVAAILISGRGSEPGVAARALAAVATPTGIAHFVTSYGATGSGEQAQYEESWIDLANPKRKRFVLSMGGRMLAQLVYVDHRVPPLRTYRSTYPHTAILGSARGPIAYHPFSYPSVMSGEDPLVVYRQLLKSGHLVSEKQVTYRGRTAYQLEIWFKPPYELVGKVWTGDRETYIVDSSTYFPLETTFRPDPVMWGSRGSPIVTRYLKFEILPPSARTSALLDPVKHPKPYRP